MLWFASFMPKKKKVFQDCYRMAGEVLHVLYLYLHLLLSILRRNKQEKKKRTTNSPNNRWSALRNVCSICHSYRERLFFVTVLADGKIFWTGLCEHFMAIVILLAVRAAVARVLGGDDLQKGHNSGILTSCRLTSACFVNLSQHLVL